jgi:hypothetical protein
MTAWPTLITIACPVYERGKKCEKIQLIGEKKRLAGTQRFKKMKAYLGTRAHFDEIVDRLGVPTICNQENDALHL